LFRQLNLGAAKNIILMGDGGKTGGSKPASTIQITGANTKGIILDASSGCRIYGLAIMGTNAAATGALISAVNLAHDFSIEHCTLAVPTVGYAMGCLLDLDYAYTCNFTNVNFSGGTYNVRGQHGTGTPANSIAFRGCEFVNYGTAAILDSGTAWTFDTCSFEPNWTTLVYAVYRYTNGVPGKGVTFRNCWMGDVQGAGTHIQWSGMGLTIRDCWIDFHTCTLVKTMENNCYGIAIKNNVLITFGNAATIIDFQATTGHGFVDIDTIVDSSVSLTRVAGTVPAGIAVKDQNVSGIGSGSPQATGFGHYFNVTVGIGTAATIGSTGSACGLNMIGSGNVFLNVAPGGRSAPTYQVIFGTSAMAVVRYTSTGTLINTPLSISSASGGAVTFDCPIAFLADNAYDLGAASFRARTIYAGTGAINTSDEREKEQIESVPDAWLDAWAEVDFVRYKWIAQVETKGDGARWHCGLIAQRIEAAFKAHGLDARKIGVLCYDEWPYSLEEWPDEFEEIEDRVSETGEVIPASRRLLRPAGKREIQAGNRYGVRYDEAFALEMALTRREMKRMKAAHA
jgi:hypothetical protein